MLPKTILLKLKNKLRIKKNVGTLESDYQNDVLFSRNSNVKVFNFWAELTRPQDLWYYHFINKYQPGTYTGEKPITFFFVYGDRRKLQMDVNRPRVFYTGENVDVCKDYKDHCLKDVDLSLGFEYLEASNYLRFPLWITWFFKPDFDFEAVKNQTYKMSHFPYDFQKRRRFATLIASHDRNGIRAEITGLIEQLGRVDCAGGFANNTRELHELYNNSKHYFLTLYDFNVCPENSNTNGYVTEKVFEAINSGCIPIYWGSNNNPEPEVLNHDAILFYDRQDPGRLIAQIEELNSNYRLYQDFVLQERFMPGAAEYVWTRFEELERKFREIGKNL